uniref:Insulin-like peptide 04 n=1 Tax=Exaiptasia diaphana TaxID=2652724 RepID=INS4_EXADI
MPRTFLVVLIYILAGFLCSTSALRKVNEASGIKTDGSGYTIVEECCTESCKLEEVNEYCHLFRGRFFCGEQILDIYNTVCNPRSIRRKRSLTVDKREAKKFIRQRR